jgi:hypothetical protein
MLQVISGKFFKSDERFRHNGFGIAYSNYAWVAPIDTCAGRVEPVDTYRAVSSYVITYMNQIEKAKDGKSVLVRIGDQEIIEQFLLLLTFGLKALFHIDRATIEAHCRDVPATSNDYNVGGVVAAPFLSSRISGNDAQIEALKHFITQVIGLQRKTYCAATNSLRSFSGALQLLRGNIDLAYSMLVYCIESLCQTHDDYLPRWEDYDEGVRRRIDKILERADATLAEQIRGALLYERNLKATVRFVDFAVAHIDDSFFTEKAVGRCFGLRRSQLVPALRNAYKMRSRYVHQLLPVESQVRYPLGHGDVFEMGNQPYLTFSGLLRVTHEVVTNFVLRQPQLEKEDYDWREDLPGVVRIKLAPQYWIGNPDSFKRDQAVRRLSGVLQNYEDALLNKSPLTDIRGVLSKCEESFAKMSQSQRRAALAMYVLYNRAIVPEGKCPDYEKYLELYKSELDELCIEMLVVKLKLGDDIPWDIDDCARCFADYLNGQFSKGSMRIPHITSVSLRLAIANRYLQTDQAAEWEQWATDAIPEVAGWPETQALIQKCIAEKSEVDIGKFLETASQERGRVMRSGLGVPGTAF